MLVYDKSLAGKIAHIIIQLYVYNTKITDMHLIFP